jgi:hypothetical protein
LPTRQHRARFSSSDIIMRLNETDMGRRGQQAYNLIDLIRTRSKTTKFSLNVNTLVDEWFNSRWSRVYMKGPIKGWLLKDPISRSLNNR